MKFTQAAVLAALCAALPTSSATYFNGDKINGVPVITDLDVNNLAANRMHRFFLRGSEINTGLPWHYPVVVARGPGPADAGKTFWLSGTVHGDELNPSAVLQRLIQNLDVSQVNGSVIIVPTVGQNGASRNSRYYYSSSSSGTYTDPNRVWPGTELGPSVTQTNYKLWQALTRNGTAVDVAVDLHTPSTGGASGLWCYADWAVPEAKRLSELIGADTLKVDPGEPGSLETTFVEFGIPAITLEIARAKVWQEEYIQRSYDFVLRALAEWQVIPKAGVPAVPQVDTYAGESFAAVIPSTNGGFYKPTVKILDDVVEGQVVGHLYNMFGDKIFTYLAPASGRVHNVNDDPLIEPGVRPIQIITSRRTDFRSD